MVYKINYLIAALVFFTTSNTVIESYDLSKYSYPINNTDKYVLFKDEKSILSVIELERENNSLLVDQILQAYNLGHVVVKLNGTDTTRKHPFIAIDSNNNAYKQVITSTLANSMDALYLRIPPRFMVYLAKSFASKSILKAAYYALSVYAGAKNAKRVLDQGKAVLMNGYWFDRASYVIKRVNTVNEPYPPKGHFIYSPPEDLLMPDLLIYLKYDVPVASPKRLTNNFWQKPYSPFFNVPLDDIYNKFNCTQVAVINCFGHIEDVVERIKTTIREMIGDKFKIEDKSSTVITVQNTDIKRHLFDDEKSIINLLEKERKFDPIKVQTILDSYKKCFYRKRRETFLAHGQKRVPFIVVDGNDGLQKQRIIQILAGKIGAIYLRTPPKCMVHLMKMFDKKSSLKDAYYALGFYAASFNIRELLSTGTPVIMNGYWYETAAFVLEKVFNEPDKLPGDNSTFYSPPKDLLKPDMLIYLDNYVRDKMWLNKPNPKFINMKKFIYEKFENPSAKIIASSASTEVIITRVHNAIQRTLGPEFNYTNSISDDIFTNSLAHFGNESSVLAYLEVARKKNTSEDVDKFLEAYRNCLREVEMRKSPTNVTMGPFIAIDGNNKFERKRITRLLSDIVGCSIFRFPLRCMVNMNKTLKMGTVLKKAFYILTYYIALKEIRELQKLGAPVLMNGYWFEEAAYNIAKLYSHPSELPKKGHSIYNPPSDLGMPDLYIFLSTSVVINSTLNWKNKVTLHEKFIHIYERFNYSPTEIIYSSKSINDTVANIYYTIKKHLEGKYNFTKFDHFFNINLNKLTEHYTYYK